MVIRRGPFESLLRSVLVLLTLASLAACSSVPDAVNPVSWYRDLSGASKDDKLDKNQPNQANLDAGSKQPYPNLASVPNAPDTATSAIDRDALQKSLIADRNNANYTNEQLHAGMETPGFVSPPAPAEANESAPASASQAASAKTADAAPPQESSLTSPTIPNVPTGEKPEPPPPPPNVAPAAKEASAAPSVPASGQRLATPAAATPAATITFAIGSAVLSDDQRDQLNEIAAAQHEKGGTIRIVGHAEATTGVSGTQQQLAQFNLALTRAKSVAQVLSTDGVPAQVIAVEAAPGRAGDANASHAEVYLER
ncbi:MAG TPA: OmpA family protein [Stellaceae bacterium]|nr:OmpA family protein [Stellaceae bacterium]